MDAQRFNVEARLSTMYVPVTVTSTAAVATDAVCEEEPNSSATESESFSASRSKSPEQATHSFSTTPPRRRKRLNCLLALFQYPFPLRCSRSSAVPATTITTETHNPITGFLTRTKGMHVEETIISEGEDFIVTRTVIRPTRRSDIRSPQKPTVTPTTSPTPSRFSSWRTLRIPRMSLPCRNINAIELELDSGPFRNSQLPNTTRHIEVYVVRDVIVEISDNCSIEGPRTWSNPAAYIRRPLEFCQDDDSADAVICGQVQTIGAELDIVNDSS